MESIYTLIRTNRLSISLQIKKGGTIIVRAPYIYPKYLIDRFVNSKSDWIKKQISKSQRTSLKLTRFCTDQKLKEIISSHTSSYSKLMQVTPHSLRFTHVKTYWGSCNPQGVISFNLKLAYTSSDIIEYVVVHELAHLRWRGHGVRFWDMVKKYYPNTVNVRKILTQLLRE